MSATSGPPAYRPDPGLVDVFGLTHQWNVRTENQDHFLIASIHKTM